MSRPVSYWHKLVTQLFLAEGAMALLSTKSNLPLLLAVCIPLVGYGCTSKNGVEDDSAAGGAHSVPNTGVNVGGSYQVGSSGGAGSDPSATGGASVFTNTWPPDGFVNVTNVEYGAYALGPEIANDINAGTGSATISNEGSLCSGLYGVIRDFQAASVTPGGHPDFEYVTKDDPGITTTTIGADGKPVYGDHPTGTVSTHGAAQFNQWYNDDKTVNRSFVIGLKMTDRNGVQSFQSDTFFPLDDQGFGNTTASTGSHNFHFTTEIHTSFTYGGGETFTFIGDDDVFVYINGQLVIDLGGVHLAETKTIKLDSLGLTAGQVYPILIFQAERHTIYSHFRFDTTLAFADCGQVPPGVIIN